MSQGRQLFNYELDNGQVITVEGSADTSPGYEEMGNEVAQGKASVRLAEVLEVVKPTFETLRSALGDVNNPDEISIAVGLDLRGKAGVLFASIDSGCSFKVTCKWLNPRTN